MSGEIDPELARTLLAHVDIDVIAGDDGTKMSPLSVALLAVELQRTEADELVVQLIGRGAIPHKSERAQVKRIADDVQRRHAMKHPLKERDEL